MRPFETSLICCLRSICAGCLQEGAATRPRQANTTADSGCAAIASLPAQPSVQEWTILSQPIDCNPYLVAQILAAATYPYEIGRRRPWLQHHPD